MNEYKYKECGLDNVIIEGMEPLIDDAGEPTYSIQNINGLHKCIAHCIVTKAFGIDPKELRFLRTELGLTQSELAEVVRKDSQTVGRWERGECPIDQTAEIVIRALAVEKLELKPELDIKEFAKRSIPSAEVTCHIIDGSNPKDYQKKAA